MWKCIEEFVYCIVHVMTYNIVKLNHQIIMDTIAWCNQIECRLWIMWTFILMYHHKKFPLLLQPDIFMSTITKSTRELKEKCSCWWWWTSLNELLLMSYDCNRKAKIKQCRQFCWWDSIEVNAPKVFIPTILRNPSESFF